MNPVKNKLQVRHYPQIPCVPFRVDVGSEHEAQLVYNALADQHCFLFNQNIIPDYSNALSVVMWDEKLDGNDKYTDYWNEAEGMEWDEYAATYLHPTV